MLLLTHTSVGGGSQMLLLTHTSVGGGSQALLLMHPCQCQHKSSNLQWRENATDVTASIYACKLISNLQWRVNAFLTPGLFTTATKGLPGGYGKYTKQQLHKTLGYALGIIHYRSMVYLELASIFTNTSFCSYQGYLFVSKYQLTIEREHNYKHNILRAECMH